MIDHVGIYGSRVAEGLSAFNVGLVLLFDVENIRRYDGCNKWWRWLQLMLREGWRGLHDSFDELFSLITQEICFEYIRQEEFLENIII